MFLDYVAVDGAQIAKVPGPEDHFRHELFVRGPLPFSSAEEAEDGAGAAVEPGDDGLWEEEDGELEQPLNSKGSEANDEGSVFAQEQTAEEGQAGHLEWWRRKRKNYAFGPSAIPDPPPRRRRLHLLVSPARLLP